MCLVLHMVTYASECKAEAKHALRLFFHVLCPMALRSDAVIKHCLTEASSIAWDFGACTKKASCCACADKGDGNGLFPTTKDYVTAVEMQAACSVASSVYGYVGATPDMLKVCMRVGSSDNHVLDNAHLCMTWDKCEGIYYVAKPMSPELKRQFEAYCGPGVTEFFLKDGERDPHVAEIVPSPTCSFFVDGDLPAGSRLMQLCAEAEEEDEEEEEWWLEDDYDDDDDDEENDDAAHILGMIPDGTIKPSARRITRRPHSV